MAEPSKGIRDPWRLHSPDRTQDQEAPVGTPGSTDPQDWDLAPHVQCHIRPTGAAGTLIIHGASTPEGGIDLLLHWIDVWPELQTLLKEAGFEYQPEEPQGFTLKSPDKTRVLCHRLRDVAHGFTLLVQTLRRAARDVPGFRKQLDDAGIVPLLV